ncbi:MAG TPA: nucleotide exchange factor GrpE [Clostridia bacterium]|nr:nucleotide exchange factor GrpE [Clostridia bacterium]
MSDRKHRQADACEAEGAVTEASVVNGSEEVAEPNANKADKETANTAKELELLKEELKDAKNEIDKSGKQCAEYLDRLQRMAAEFDNFKKRSVKEKESLYIDAVSDVAGAFIPVMDNVERALKAISADESARTLKDGVEMVFKQFGDVLKNLGVEEIKAVGEQFDPMRHNAVMHAEDESLGHNVVIEEFQKGYIYKDKVIRYSMVKVAN